MMKSSKLKFTELKEFQHLFKREKIPAKTILLSEGKVSKEAYYIEKGCIRMFFNNNGKDITFQFFFEEQFVSSIESFITEKPSSFTLESIEPSVICSITKKDFQKTISDSPIIKQQVEDLFFQRLVSYQKLFLSQIRDSPEKRYTELLQENPELLLRIPQHYIASFLGITSVSLSRIRNR